MLDKMKNWTLKKVVLLLVLALLVTISSTDVRSFPVPTLVMGNIENTTNIQNVNQYEISIYAYEAGSNFSNFITKEDAKLDTSQMLFGGVLATDHTKIFDIVVEARLLSPLYRHTGFAYAYNISATERVDLEIILRRTLRIFPEPEPENPSHPPRDSAGGGAGGGSGGGAGGGAGGDTRRSEIPPIGNESEKEAIDNFRRQRQEQENILRQQEEEEAERLRQEQESKTVESTTIPTYLIVLMTLTIIFIIGIILLKRKKGKMITTVVLLGLFIILSSNVSAQLTPFNVRGDIFGPDKYDADVEVVLVSASSGDILDQNTMTSVYNEPHPFYAFAFGLPPGTEFYAFTNVNNGDSFGHNFTPDIRTPALVVLDIIMRAPLPIHEPLNESYINSSTFLINWSYPNNDWILFDVEIDTNSDFSSPIRSWELNETSYDMLPAEELPDNNYYIRVRSKDVSDSGNHIYIDETIIELVVDTTDPEIISYSPANETWFNNQITIRVDTNEDATCRLDQNPGTPFSSKPITMSGVNSTIHQYTTSFTADGQYDYYIQCIDLAGNILDLSNELHLRYFYDTVQPVTTNNYTQHNTWTTEDALIELTATDASPSSGIAWTRYCLGAGCNPTSGINYAGPIALSEGDHILRYRSRDNAGNTEAIQQVNVRIDQTAPTSSHDYLYHNTWRPEDAVISISATDPMPGSGLDYIEYCFGDGCTPNIEYTGALTITDENITYLRFRSVDNIGNTESTNEVIILIDKTGPSCDAASIEIEGGATYATDTTLFFTFTGFEDDLSGIWRYHYSFTDSGGVSNPTTNTFGTIAGAAQGEVQVYVWAQDNVGNFGCSVSESIIVDTIPPEFVDFENENLDSDSVGPLRVNATIVDATTSVQGVPTIRYRYGGGPWSDYYLMDNLGDDVYGYDIPEFPAGWFNFRTQNVHWEINVTDILGNHDIAPIQSEFVDALNYAPFFDPVIENTSVRTFQLLEFWIDAIDINNDGIENQELTFASNVSNISITKFNNSRALVQWFPDNSWAVNNEDTNHTINFTVTDDGTPSLTGWQLVTIQVNFTNLPPVLEPIGPLSVDENDTLYYQVQAYDPDGDTITFYDNSTLFDIDPVTGEIFYEPDWTDVGIYFINITVGDHEFNVSEIITLTVVNVENNVTFFVRDRILERPLDNVTLFGGQICSSGCTFDDSIRIIEPNGDYNYILSKPGFGNYTLNNQPIYDETNYTILLNDTEPPYIELSHIPLDYHILETGLRFVVNTTFWGEDNFFITNATLDYIRYDKTMQEVYEVNSTVLDIIESEDESKLFNITLGNYSSSFLMDANVTLVDLYDNYRIIPLVRTQFLFDTESMQIAYPPIMENIRTPQYLLVDEPYNYVVNASDFMGEDITFSDNSTIFNIHPTTGVISFTPAIADEGVHFVNITASNGHAEVSQVVEYRIEEGKEITFLVRDDLLILPIDNVLLKGGRECNTGCQFSGSISLIEMSDLSTYNFSAPGFNSTEITFSATSDETIEIYLRDNEPAVTDDINITAWVTEDEREFYVNISAHVTDNLGIGFVDFVYEIIDSDNPDYIGMTNTLPMFEDEPGIFTTTMGPFNSSIYFYSRQEMYDFRGNYNEHNNALRHFMFSAKTLTIPEIVMTKNVEYLDQTLYTVRYRISTTIHNTAGEDLENVMFIDTDINTSIQYLNISKEDSVTLERIRVYDKSAVSGRVELVPSAASVLSKNFYSNEPVILIPGFGGPFDLIIYPHQEVYSSLDNITMDIYLENMNPDFGQDGFLTYWIEGLDGAVYDLRQESLFVQASSSLIVERYLSRLSQPMEDGYFRIQANLTWTQGQAAFATRTFYLEVYADCEDGIKNQDETDIDCGGSVCGPCIDGLKCISNSDCISNRCISGFCFPATCNDGIQNQGETDVDCGGPCAPCSEGLRCVSNNDCRSGICENNICMPYQDHCYDGVMNNGETDVDCGGPCRPCDAGKSCNINEDCQSLNCALGICLPATCNDGIQNQGEEGVDCGGPCAPCLFEIDRTVEKETDNYHITGFGESRIITSGNPNFLSMHHEFDKNIVMYEEPFVGTTIIRNNGPVSQDVLFTKIIPKKFDVIPIDDLIITRTEDGDTIIEWEGTLRSSRSRKLEYYLIYNEKYRLNLEVEKSNIRIHNNTFNSGDFIRIYSKQRLIEKLQVRKLLSYNELGENASVTIELQNIGEVTLRNISIYEYMRDDTFTEFWKDRDGRINIVEIKPNEYITFDYETGIHDDITTMPVIFGVEPNDVVSMLVIDSHHTLIERIITFIKIQSLIALALLAIIILYLYNLNVRKNKHNMNLRDSLIKSISDTDEAIKKIPKYTTKQSKLLFSMIKSFFSKSKNNQNKT